MDTKIDVKELINFHLMQYHHFKTLAYLQGNKVAEQYWQSLIDRILKGQL